MGKKLIREVKFREKRGKLQFIGYGSSDRGTRAVVAVTEVEYEGRPRAAVNEAVLTVLENMLKPQLV